MSERRTVRIFRNGRNQAIRIPVEFELPGEEALIHREGDRLVIEPILKSSLTDWLSKLEPVDWDFEDGRPALLPSRPIEL